MSADSARPPRERGMTLLRRLRFTPMRDVLLGRLSGRLDVDVIVSRSELPEPLQSVVRETVRATRLGSSERVDVARELVAHFEDGLLAGAAERELLESFGDSRRAATLIRRAKIRGRSAFWHARRLLWRATGAVAVVLLTVYAILAIRVYGSHPTLARNFLEELNEQPRAVPASDRAWPLYREAALGLGPWPAAEDRDESPDGAAWGAYRDFAERHQPALRRIHEAARKPHVGILFSVQGDPELAARESPERVVAAAALHDPNPPVISILLPQLNVLRKAARLTMIDVHIGLLERDATRVAENLETVIRISDHTFQMPFLISDLMSLSLLTKVCELTGHVVATAPDLLSDEQLADLSHRLAAARGGGTIRVRVVAERTFFDDMIQRMYTDDGRGDGRLARTYFSQFSAVTGVDAPPSTPSLLESLALPAASAIIAGRREMQAKFDELMALVAQEAATPLWKRSASIVDQRLAEMKQSPLASARYPLLTVLFPALSRATAMGETATMRRDGTLVALAAELYRRHTGAWPPTLAALTPRYLPAVPLDRCDGLPLRYRLLADRPVVYSIGGDRDDDGGRPPHGPDGNRRAARAVADLSIGGVESAATAPDGDWILWP